MRDSPAGDASGDRHQWRNLAGNARFQRYWVGAAAGAIGFSMLSLPLELFVLDSTGQARQAAGIIACMATTQLLLAPFGGWLADRFERTHLLVTCDAGRLLTCFGVLLIVQFDQHVALLFAASVLFGAVQAAGAPARAVLLRELVSAQTLFVALRQDELRINLAKILGPLLAGALYAVGPIWALSACMFWFAASAVSVLTLAPLRRGASAASAVARKASPSISLAEFRELLWHGRGVLLGVWVLSTSATIASVLAIVGLRDVGISSDLIGVVIAAEAVGGIVGALILRRWAFGNVAALLSVSFAFCLTGFVIFGFTMDWRVAGVSLLVIGVASSVVGVVLDHQIFQRAESSVRGRVIAATFVIVGLAAVLARVGAGVLLDSVEFPYVGLAVSAYAVLLMLLGFVGIRLLARRPQS